jgi:YesN/AraC family two-component response regulator
MYKVLLIDDEKWVRAALRWTLEKTGLSFRVVQECENGLEALDWLKTNQVDLVFTDVSMPVMDGLSFVKMLRQQSEKPDVIIISVHEEFQYVQQALRHGVADYLLKPVELVDLTACLEKWLQQNARQQEPQLKKVEEAAGLFLSTVDQVIKYIQETPPGEVTLADAAKRVHMNASYLSQLFKQRMNMNFVDYVTEQRIKEAKKLLCNTSLRVSEISHRMGYSDVAYFCTIFKKITGRTPSEHRKC